MRHYTYKVWTTEEARFVRENFKLMSTKEIAERLERTEASVYSFGYEVLGLRKRQGGGAR